MADDAMIEAEPLRPWMRRGLFAAVVFFHVGAGWALTRVHLEPIVAGDAAPMEVSFVAAEPPTPEPPQMEPPKEQPPDPPQLESMIQPPPPDLPPPAFPVPAPPPPKPVAKPQPKPQAQQAAPSPAPPAATPPQNTGPKTLDASQVAYLNNPPPAYPARARRNRETGTVTLRVLVDATGRPAEVGVQASSGHAELDGSAVSGVRGWRFRPYSENGVAQAVVVLVPIVFQLQ